MNMKTKLLTAFLGGSLIAGNLLAAPIEIYSEAFLRTNTPNNNRLLDVSWAADGHYKGNWRTYDAAGNNMPTGSTAVSNNNDLPRMISNGAGGDSALGFLFVGIYAGNVAAMSRDSVLHGIVLRDETPVFNSGGGITANHFEWQNLRGFSIDLSRGTHNGAENASTRAVIQIGTDWFASETTFNPAAAATWETHTIADISTETWRTLSFDSGNNNAVSLGTTAQTLSAHGASGSLTSVGFHLSTTGSGSGSNSQYRIDNIAVTAIPEPGTLVLFGIAVGSVFLFRRRKK